jgi:hypothetical protein
MVLKMVGSNGDRLNSLSKPELIALLLYVPGAQGRIGEPIVGSTRLMKIVFLLYEEANIKELKSTISTFVPFRFGPYDSEVFDAIEALKILCLVETNAEKRSQEKNTKTELTTDDQSSFKLTDQGITRVQRIAERVSPDLYRTVSNYKATYGKKPLSEILQYVYNKYPGFAARSEIAAQYL